MMMTSFVFAVSPPKTNEISARARLSMRKKSKISVKRERNNVDN